MILAETVPMFNWEISVGNVINISILITGLIWFFYGLQGRIQLIEHDIKSSNGIGKIRSTQIAEEAKLKSVETRLNRLDTVLETLQRALNRLELMDERLLTGGKRLDDLSKRFTDWLNQTYEERHEALRSRIERMEIKTKEK